MPSRVPAAHIYVCAAIPCCCPHGPPDPAGGVPSAAVPLTPPGPPSAPAGKHVLDVINGALNSPKAKVQRAQATPIQFHFHSSSEHMISGAHSLTVVRGTALAWHCVHHVMVLDVVCMCVCECEHVDRHGALVMHTFG